MGDLAYWPSDKPLTKKDKFAKNRDFIKKLHHIDQIWEKLKFKFGFLQKIVLMSSIL